MPVTTQTGQADTRLAKRTIAGTISVTTSLSTTEQFEHLRATRILNESGGAVVLTVYQRNPVTGNFVLAKDIGTDGVLASLADGASLELPPALFGSDFLKLVGDGAANLHFLSAD